MTLYYGDEVDGDYAVEIYDQVEVRIDGHTHDGTVIRLHPRSHEVTVRYEDHLDTYRTTGNPRQKSARVHLLAVDLVARDG